RNARWEWSRLIENEIALSDVEHAQDRTAAKSWARNNVGIAVVVGVGGGNIHSTAEARIVGQEAGEYLAIEATEHFDVRAAAGARRGDNVRSPIVVHVTDGHADTAAEGRIIGKTVKEYRSIDTAE